MRKTFQEGEKAKQNFERTMVTLFKVSKTELAEKIKNKKKKGKD